MINRLPPQTVRFYFLLGVYFLSLLYHVNINLNSVTFTVVVLSQILFNRCLVHLGAQFVSLLFFFPRTIPHCFNYLSCSDVRTKNNIFLKNRAKLNKLYAYLIFMQNSQMKVFSILCKTMDLKIASLNVRGIGNNTKRREVFNWLR